MAASRPSTLDAHLGYRLRAVSNHVSQSFARLLDGQGVTVAEWVLLRELFDGELASPSRVAEGLGLTRGAVSKLADRLAAKALIERAPDGEDGRAQRLALTDAGRALVPRLAGLADANDEACFAPLSDAERKTLRALLDTLARYHALAGAPLG